MNKDHPPRRELTFLNSSKKLRMEATIANVVPVTSNMVIPPIISLATVIIMMKNTTWSSIIPVKTLMNVLIK